jgi:hypothetical protein
MQKSRLAVTLAVSGTTLALGLMALALILGTTSGTTAAADESRTIDLTPEGWHDLAWSGADATDPGAVLTCISGKYSIAYAWEGPTAGFKRHVEGCAVPGVCNMSAVNKYDTLLVLMTEGGATCQMPVAPSTGPRTVDLSPQGWHDVAWSGANGTHPATALACLSGKYTIAYAWEGPTGGFKRYVEGCTVPGICNMAALNEYDTVLVSIAAGTSCEMPVGSSAGTSPWFVSSDWSSVAVIVLDFETFRLKRAYISYHPSCDDHPMVSDDNLRWRAGGIFDAAGEYWSGQVKEEALGRSEVLDFEVSHLGDFAVLHISPGDFGAIAVSDPCSGRVLFAGSVIWAGRGEQLYPAVPIEPDALERTPGQAPPPQRLDVLGQDYEPEEQAGLAAWDSVRYLNLVKDLASSPYSVLVYLYPRSVGAFFPENADWIIFVHHTPSG